MVPSVTKQGFPAEFIQHEPGVRCFNSALFALNGLQLLATRRCDPRTLLHDIVINRLEGNITRQVCVVRLPRKDGRENFEDPRLFMHRGKLHLSYVEGRYWYPGHALQQLAVLGDDFSVEQVITIPFGDNGVGYEKNWQFFVLSERLYFVYSVAPHIVVELTEDYKVKRRFFTQGRVPFMDLLRGGTPPQHIPGFFQCFVHFHTDHFSRNRRYGMCAYRFYDSPPFEPASLSEVLLRGSEEDPTLPNVAHPTWNPLVIFPCGIIKREDHWLVSAGINDSTDVLLKLPFDIKHTSIVGPVAK
jgi:hypothetical protein